MLVLHLFMGLLLRKIHMKFPSRNFHIECESERSLCLIRHPSDLRYPPDCIQICRVCYLNLSIATRNGRFESRLPSEEGTWKAHLRIDSYLYVIEELCTCTACQKGFTCGEARVSPAGAVPELAAIGLFLVCLVLIFLALYPCLFCTCNRFKGGCHYPFSDHMLIAGQHFISGADSLIFHHLATHNVYCLALSTWDASR